MIDKSKTIADYALNYDGKTYHAAGVVQFLYAARNLEITREEAEAVLADVRKELGRVG